jgi:hypothetical protein
VVSCEYLGVERGASEFLKSWGAFLDLLIPNPVLYKNPLMWTTRVDVGSLISAKSKDTE